MAKKPKRQIKVLRNNEIVDPQSTYIRSDQVERLKKLGSVKVKRTLMTDPVKLNSKTATAVYTSGKNILCEGCKKFSPTKRMFKYRSSTRGSVTLCEVCDLDTEVRSFRKLDALDWKRKEIKVE